MALFETAHSCVHCQKRFLIRDHDDPRPLLHIDGPRSDRYWRLWSPDKAPIKLSELERMAADECAIARYLYERLTSGQDGFSGDAIINRVPPHMDDTEPNSIVITLSGENRADTNAYFTYMTEEESDIAHEVCQRPPNLDPASVDAFNLARKWVLECHQNHPSCSKPGDSFMPARIIEISSSGRRINILQDAAAAPYAVLSYCWGGPQRVTLTKSRMQDSQLSFGTESLPRTLQDSIRVCCELDLKYLWVDALCIVQDDPEDKSTEIADMANIYQNSYVAIMASRARSAEDGFLQPRAPFGAGDSSPGFRLPYEAKDRKKGSIILMEEPNSQTYVDPLSTRAWAFQEFVLSPRILDYGELRTTWICRAEETPTDGFSSPPTTCWSRQRFHELASSGSETTISPPHALWSTMVLCYMGSSLTDPYDRLPALAGIAERFNTVIDDEYVAGCWKSHIWMDLLWWQENGRNRVRPAEYFAPSWSWASIPLGGFNYVSTKSCSVDGGFEVLGHQVQLYHRAVRYGTVLSGFLQVRGRIVPDECFPDPTDFESHHRQANFEVPGHCLLGVSSSLILDPRFRNVDITKRPTFGLCICWDEKRDTIRGLMLCEVDCGLFRRIGLFSLNLVSDLSFKDTTLEERVKMRDACFKVWRESLPTKVMKLV